MRTLRTYPLVWSVVSLLAIVAAAAIVWWLVPDRTLSAQESMEDACADPSTITAFDVTIQAEGVTEWTESEVSKSPDGVISFTTRIYGEDQGPGSGAGVRSGVRLQSESFNTYEAPPPASARSSSTTPVLVDVGGRYYNRRLENGQWTPWEVSTTSIDIVEGGLHNTFCGESLNMFDTFEYNGFEQINGVQTKKYTGIMDLQGNELDYRFEYWVGPDGRMVRTDRTNLANDRPITWTFSNWNEPNDIAPPVQETPAPKPPATPEPTHTPVLTNTPTPEPTNTPTPAPTNTPVPAAADAWLKPDPSGITFDGQWREFTIRGTGVERIDFAINVINYPNGPSSTGAVELSARNSLPPASDACQTTRFTGYAMSSGFTFHLVGCEAGTVIIQLADRDNDYIVLREYTVTVSGGP